MYLDVLLSLRNNSSRWWCDLKLSWARYDGTTNITDIAINQAVMAACFITSPAICWYTQVECHGDERSIHQSTVASVHKTCKRMSSILYNTETFIWNACHFQAGMVESQYNTSKIQLFRSSFVLIKSWPLTIAQDFTETIQFCKELKQMEIERKKNHPNRLFEI